VGLVMGVRMVMGMGMGTGMVVEGERGVYPRGSNVPVSFS